MSILHTHREVKLLVVVLALLGLLLVSVAVSAQPQARPSSGVPGHASSVIASRSALELPAVAAPASASRSAVPVAGAMAAAALFQAPPPETPTDGFLLVTGTVDFDAVRTTSPYSTSANSNAITVSSSTGFSAGDEILIIDMDGTGIGTHETAMVSAVNTNVLTLTTDLEHSYDGQNDKIMVQRVPYYSGVQISGTLTVAPWDGQTGGVIFFRAVTLTVENGGSIDANGLGFGSKKGPGAGEDSYHLGAGGAGHGGRGGEGHDPEGASGGGGYGSVYDPVSLGSGGGNRYYDDPPQCGGAGGGAIRVVVSDLLRVDGYVSANGMDGLAGDRGCGGGSGGSIWIETDVLTGTGNISATGGDGSGTWPSGDARAGGGSGGRIAVDYDESGFQGDLEAAGGYGFQYGGPGTIYTQQSGTSGSDELWVDNQEHDGESAVLLQGAYAFDILQLEKFGHLIVVGSDSTLTITDSILLGDGSARLTAEGVVEAPSSFTVTNVILAIKRDLVGPESIALTDNGAIELYAAPGRHGGIFTFTNISVGTGTTLTLLGYDGGTNDQDDDKEVELRVENLTVETNGFLSADGTGYGSQKGPEAGHYDYDRGAGGAGHGGEGGLGANGASGGGTYGSLYEPRSLGSGGGNRNCEHDIPCGGGAGGGAVHLVVSDTLFLDGFLSANGMEGLAGDRGCGGGSGGSLWIETTVLTGAGYIQAMGGNGSGLKDQNHDYQAGGGGGGRIAIYAGNIDDDPLAGRIQARGGLGHNNGITGTVFLNSVDHSLSTVVAKPVTGIVADGILTSVVTVTLFNTDGYTMPNEAVSLEVEHGTGNLINGASIGQQVPISIGLSDTSGKAIAALASTVAEAKTLRAWAGQEPLDHRATVTFTSGPPDVQTSLVSAAPDHVAADGTSPATVTVQVFDQYQNPVPGVSVALTHTGGVSITLGQPASPTGADGRTTGTIRGGAPQVVTVQASISGTTIADTAQVTFVGADLAVTKSGPDVALVGVPLTYTLTVRNQGYTVAEGVALTDTLPTGLNFVTCTASCNHDGQVLTWQVGTIDDGDQVTAALVVTASPTIPHGTAVWNHLAAATASTEVNTANNSTQEKTVIHHPVPRLQVTPSYSELTLRCNTMQTMTLTVQNVGTGIATGVHATRQPYEGWISISDELPDLAPGASATAVITLSPTGSVPLGTYRDLVTISASQGTERQAALALRVVDVTRTLSITVSSSQPVTTVAGANVHLMRREETWQVTEGAVTIVHQQVQSQTNESGVVVFQSLDAGVYDYVAWAPGYGATQDVVTVTAGTGAQPLPVSLEGLPLLMAEPAWPTIHVRRGQTGSFEAAVRNVGLASAHDLAVTLRAGAPDWLYVGTIGATDELTAGEALSVTLLASPPLTLTAPVTHEEFIYVSADDALTTGFALAVRVDDRLTGSLQILVTDPEGLPVEGALVALVDKQVSQVIRESQPYTYYATYTGESDPAGVVSFENIPEGSYNSYADAVGYEPVAEDPVIEPGELELHNILMEPLPFTADWTITETEISDVYSISVRITFQVGHLQVLPVYLSIPCEDGFVEGSVEVRNPLDHPITDIQVAFHVPNASFLLAPGPSEIDAHSTATYYFIATLVDDWTRASGEVVVSGEGALSGWAPVHVETCTGDDWTWGLCGDEACGSCLGETCWSYTPDLPPPQDGTVTLRLSQDGVLERQAFLATLRLNIGIESVDDLEVRITATDADGRCITDSFTVTPTVPTLFSDLAPGQSIVQLWTIVPAYLDITEPAAYTLRATLIYTTAEVSHAVTSLPAVVWVYPQPEVHLSYYLPGHARANDPFLLGVRAENKGPGTARNLRIQSSQPEIIDPAEVPVSFHILGTFENGQLHPGDMLLNLGNIEPGKVVTGGWMMATSYHGTFIGLSYRCEHLDYRGMPLSNLIWCDGGENIYDNELQYLNSDECPYMTGSDKQGSAGGPINTGSGNYHYAAEDISLPAVGSALAMGRSYDSSNVVSGTTALSPGWTHRYAMHLEFPSPSGQTYFTEMTGDAEIDRSTVFYRPVVVAWLANGSRLRFADDGPGEYPIYHTYTTYPGSHSTLTSQISGETVTYTLTAADETARIFDAEGRLRTIRDRQGNETHLSYDAEGQLTQVTDPTGQRSLEFGYDANGRLTGVSDPAERQVRYGYDLAGDLVVVTDTAGLEWTYAYTGSHLLHEVHDPTGGLVERTDYDSAGRAVTQEDGAGVTLTLSYGEDATTITESGRTAPQVHYYDVFGTLVSDVDSMRHDESYEYNGDYQRVRSVDALGHATLMEWSSCCGRLSSITDPRGHVTRMNYDDHGNLLSRTDALSRTTTYNYDDNRLMRVTDPLSGTTSYTYNSYGQVLSVTDANLNTTRYGYDELGQRVVMTDALGTVTTYGYDPTGQLITTTTAAGTALERTTCSEYDAGGRLVQTTENYWAEQAPGYLDQYNLITTFEYDPAGRLITTTMAAGTDLERVSTNRYEGTRLVETTENYRAGPPGSPDQYNLITTYGYDPAGRLVTTTVAAGTPLQRLTVNQYDDTDRLTRTIDNYRAGQGPGYLDQYNLITEYSYDAVGNQLQVTSPDGRATRYGYDDLNRQITVTENYLPGEPQNYQNEYNLLTRYEYNPVGNRVATTNTLGIVTRYEYDDADRVEWQAANYVNGVYDPLHPDEDVLTRFGYDLAGNQVVVTDTLGRPTLYDHDDLNRVVTVTNAMGGKSVSVYDAAGDRVLAIDAEQHSTAYEYDRLGRLVTMTRTAGTEPYTTTYAYDLLGNRLRQTDAEHHSTWYAYDSLGRAITVTDALGNETVQAYDLLGNRVQTTDALLRSTEYGYDSLGRLVVITNMLDARPITTTYTFDVAGNRTSIADALGHRTAYGYDSLGRVITVTDAALNSTHYAYDPAGNRTSTTDAEGITTCYGYDDLSRLNAVTENCVAGVPSTPMTNVLTVYTYDGAGHRVGVTDARGYSTTYVYDDLDRLWSATDALTNATSYGYDRVGNRTVMTDANEAVTTYVYDDLYRLASIHYPDAVDEFAYDKVGNRLAMTDTSDTTLYEYDDLYRLTGVTDGQSQAVRYGYDQVGNRTVITYPGSLTVTYGYDPLNRLETVTDWDGGVTRYTYDDAGRLVGVSRPDGIETNYAYDAAGHLTELSHARGSQLLARYVYTLDRVGNRVGVTETLLYPAPSMDGAAGLPPQLIQADDAPLDADRIAIAYGLPKPATAAISSRSEAHLSRRAVSEGEWMPELSAPLPTALSTGEILSRSEAERISSRSEAEWISSRSEAERTTATIDPVAIASLWPAVYVADTWGAAAPNWPLEAAQTTPAPPPTSTLTSTLPPPPTPAPSLTPTDEPTPWPSATPVLTLTATPTPSIEPTATPPAAPTQLPTETPVPLPTPTEPGPPASVIVQLERATLTADGRSSVLLVALVLDDGSKPVIDGTPVQLLATGGQVSPTEAQTAGGLVFARFQAGTESGVGYVEIQVGGVTANAELTLTPLPAGQARLDDGSLPPDAPLPFDLQEVVERARNQIQIPVRGLPFVERLGHRATFDAGSVRFAPRGGLDLPEPVTTTIELAGVYAGGQPLFEGPAPAVPDIAGNAVRFERAPGLVEEYLARDGGIEQRLRLDAQPTASGDLTMAVEVQTPLDLAPAEGGEGFVFRWIGPRGERMVSVASYDRALALDADGRAKRATLSAQELAPTRPGARRYRLEMTFPADWLAAAHYPVVVDPLIGGLLQLDIVPGTQSMPAVAYNSTDGQYLVVWQDNRNGNYDIYGQLIDSDGLLSGQNLAIRAASGDQTLPDVAYDPVDDTYLVAWRSGTTSIHAQRVDSTGSLVGSLLDLTGMIGNTVDRPAVAYSSSAGYWLVAWQQWAGGVNENDVRARAVSGAGSMATTFTAYSATGDDAAPDVAANGSQGFLVAWERADPPSGIYARRTTTSAADGDAFVVASGMITSKVAPRLTYNADDDEFLAAWQDLGTGYDTVWGRRVRGQYDVSGQLVGDAFQVSDAGQADCGGPAVTYLAASGGENGRYLVAWEQGARPVDLYARWVLTDGTPSGSFTLTGADGGQEDVALAFGPAMTTTLATWTDGRAGNSDVYARSVEAGGDLGAEVMLHPAPGDQQLPQAAYNPDDVEYLVVWQDYRQGTSNPDIYGQRVTGEGLPVGSNIAVNTASYRQIAPRVAYAAQGQVYLVVWCHYTGTGEDVYDVYGQRLSRTGQLQGSPLVIANESGTTGQEYPTDVVYNSTSDRFLVLWDDMAATKYWDVWGRHVSTDGSLGDVVQITNQSGYHEDSGAGAYDPDDDQYLITWKYRAVASGAGDIQGRRVTGSGTVNPETIAIATGTAEQQNPAVAYLAGAGRYVAVWEDNRNGNYDVYGQLVSPAGTLDGDNYAIGSASQNDRFPRLAMGGSGGGLVAWQRDDGGSAANELYGRRLGSDGRPTGDGFTLLAAGGEQQRPVAAYDEAGRYLLAWQDNRNGNWDIYGSLYEPLQAGFSATPTLGITPLQVEFTDESTPAGAADAWRWAFGDGASGASSAQHPVYTYTQGGVYTVTQWVTDTDTAEEAVLTRTHYITVYQAVEAGFAAEPTGGPAPLTVAFSNTSTGDYDASLWRFGDGVTGTLDSPTHTYTIPDVYTVTLSVEGLGGMDSLTRTHYITAYTPVEPGFTAAPRTGIAPLTVAFTNTTSGDYATSLWWFGDGLTSTLDSPEHVYTSGLFSVTLTASGPGGTDTLTYTHYISVSRLATTTIVYGYDPLYRLTSAAYSTGEVYTYTYDEVGNRLKAGAGGQETAYDYDNANRLTQVGNTVYNWDNNGNLLDDGVRTYEYDGANRLVAVVSGTVTTTFAYNGDGHRMSEAINGVTTTYVIAVLGLPQAIVETTGSETIRYVFGQDLLAEQHGAAWAYHLDDGLGSVRQLADEEGQIVLAQGYAPFGEPLWSEGSGTTGFGFTGERWEAYTGLLFLRARYYEPGTGRFINADTAIPNFLKPSTLNLFFYAENNPANFFDPSGHQSACPGPCPCPKPPMGKRWEYLGEWGVSVYGNADEQLWGPGDQQTKQWTGLDGKIHTKDVYSRWVRNIEKAGTAGRLKVENSYIWLRCKEGNPVCSEVTESDATQGGLRRYLDVAVNPCPLDRGIPHRYCRSDGVRKGTTLCIDRLPNYVLTVRDWGHGQPGWDDDPKRKTEWVDLWMGLYGPDYEHFRGYRNAWILKADRPPVSPECLGWRICPI